MKAHEKENLGLNENKRTEIDRNQKNGDIICLKENGNLNNSVFIALIIIMRVLC